MQSAEPGVEYEVKSSVAGSNTPCFWVETSRVAIPLEVQEQLRGLLLPDLVLLTDEQPKRDYELLDYDDAGIWEPLIPYYTSD